MGLVSFLFSFNGRINRARYWQVTVLSGMVYAIVYACAMSLIAPAGKSAFIGASVAVMLMGFMMMALGVISLAAQVKRFHDRGRSGYFVLVPLIPVVLLIIEVITGVASGKPPMQVVASVLMWILVLGGINLWFFIDLGCLPGTEGPNKYGNPPGSGGGSYTPTPSAPIPGAGAKPNTAAAAANSMFSAQAAIDRAIAEKGRPSQPQAQARPQPRATTTPAPAGGGAPASFGRRVR